MAANLILAGTAKGLFPIRKNGGEWRLEDPVFNGETVYAVGKSPNTTGGRLWAAPFTEWMGTTLQLSDDGGRSWEKSEGQIAFPEDTETALKKIWQIQSDDSGRIFCGVEPSALFISGDKGKSWQLCRGLWDHPHRAEWQPGGGGLCLHTILLIDENIWIVGMSTGGVYRTEDGGKTWAPHNQKITAPFFPDPEPPEFGQCVHKIAYHPDAPERMLLQHHWGVYRSDDMGKSWVNTAAGKLPTDFGFACVMNAKDQGFIIPITADVFRCFPDKKMRVYRTQDCGETWRPLSKGLPQEDVYDCVLRDNMAASGSSIAFGTTGGEVYVSEDNGESWTNAAAHLPRVDCVRIY
jgi:photosystem II stability/assembly factor-like uncharacterized protein